MWKCLPSLALYALLMPALAYAVGEVPHSFTLDGTLYASPTGSSPLLDTGARIRIQILPPTGSCVLYDEEQTVNTATSDGAFSIQVGTPTGSGRRVAGSDSGNTMAQVFQNKDPIDGNDHTCSAPALAATTRRVRVIVTPTSGSPETLSPEMVIGSMPSAHVAETLQGVPSSGFLKLGAGSLTQANAETVFSSTNYPTLTALLAGGSTGSTSASSYTINAGTGGAGGINFNINGVNRALIDYSGNMGVGTGATPGARLAVQGSSAATPAVSVQGAASQTADLLQLKNNSGTILATFKNDGSLGIGTATPLAKLHVVGTSGTTLRIEDGNQANGRVLTSNASGVASWADLPSLLSPSLASTKIWVGDTGGTAAAVAVSGDLSVTNAGAFKVESIHGRGIDATLPSLTGQVYRYDNTSSSWKAAYLGLADIRSTSVPGNSILPATACTADKTLNWSSFTDQFTCQSIGIADSQVTFASKTQKTFLAAPNGADGTPTFRTITAADLPSGTASQWTGSSDIYYNGGNVGIGTSPGTRLDVLGSTSGDLSTRVKNSDSAGRTMLDLRNSTDAYAQLVVAGSTYSIAAFRDSALFSAQNDFNILTDASTASGGSKKVNFTTGGYSNSPTMTITGGNPGRVGIGASAPDANLHVTGSSGTTLKIVDGNQANGRVLTSNASGVASWADLPATTQQWAVNVNKISYSLGNVGIGISNPTAALHVVAAAAGSNLITATAVPGNGGASFTVNEYGIAAAPEFLSGNGPRMAYDGNVSTGAFTTTGTNYITSGGGGSTAYNILVKPSGTGKVGIGTLSPEASLHVKMPVYNASTHPFNLALEDPAPSAAGVGGGFVFSGNDGVSSDRWFSGVHGGKENATSGDYGGFVGFYTRLNGSGTIAERMRVDSNGRVGIGTTSPDTKLHVVGTSGNTLKIVDGNQSNGRVLTSNAAGVASWADLPAGTSQWTGTTDIYFNSGKVGIGTTTPGAALEVSGALRLSSSTADSYSTPLGTAVASKINIPNYSPAAYGQLVAMGLPSTAPATARAITLFDARTAAHQPTLSLISPDENNYLGLSFDGSNTIGYLKSTLDVGVMARGYEVASFSANTSTDDGIVTVKAIGASGKSAIQFNQAATPVGFVGLQASRASFDVTSQYFGVPLQLGTYSGTAMTILSSNNNVGIGTSSPNTRLEVSSGTSNVSGLRFTSLTSASPTSTGQAIGVDSSGNVVTVAASGGSSQWTGTTDIYFNSGKVGIGTTTPSGIFDVQGGTSTYLTAAKPIKLISQTGNGVTGGGVTITSGSASNDNSVNGGPIDITAGDGPNAGGSVTIKAGASTTGTTGSGGGVTITAGNVSYNSNSAGNVTLNGGTATFNTSKGGNVLLMPGSGPGQNGRVGINTSSPLADLHLVGTTADSAMQIGPSTTASNANASIVFRGKSGGTATGQATIYANYSNNLILQPASSRDISFMKGDGSATQMIIKDTGSVAIGTGTVTEKLNVGGNVLAASFLYSSDRRLKTEITELDGALARLLRIKGVNYYWRAPKTEEEKRRQLGVIAQDVESVYPEAVVTSGDGIKRVNYPALVAPVIEAIRELSEMVTGHGARLKHLEEENRALKQHNAELEKRMERIERSLSSASSAKGR